MKARQVPPGKTIPYPSTSSGHYAGCGCTFDLKCLRAVPPDYGLSDVLDQHRAPRFWRWPWRFFEIVPEGSILRRGYGVCYDRVFWHMNRCAEVVTCPVPLNLVVGRVRELWVAAKFFHPRQTIARESEIQHAAYQKGKQQGLEEGYNRGRQAVFAAIEVEYKAHLAEKQKVVEDTLRKNPGILN